MVKSSNSGSIIPRTVKRPSGVHMEAQQLKAAGGLHAKAGEGLETVQHAIDILFNALQQPLPLDTDEQIVTMPGGQMAVRTGTHAVGSDIYHGTSYYDLDTSRRVWIGLQLQQPRPIVGITNAGGLFRVEVTGHTYKSRDTVFLRDAGPATGRWQVTVVDANHLDLVGSTYFAGYASGGLCQRYYAGLLCEQFGIGSTFDTAKLRMWANGDLELNDAILTLTQGGIVTEIQNLTDALVPAGSVGVRISQVVSGDTYKSLSHARGLVFTKNTTELAHLSSYGDYGEVRVDHPSGANATLSTNGNIARCVVNGTGSYFTCDAHDGVYGTFTYSKPGGGSGTITVKGGIVTSIT